MLLDRRVSPYRWQGTLRWKNGVVFALFLLVMFSPIALFAQGNNSGVTVTHEEVEEMETNDAHDRSMTDPTPGTRFRDCDTCPEVIVLPPGNFMMGSPTSERGRYENEGPIHEVNIDYAFAIGVYEVTFAEWDACLASGGCDGYRPKRRFFGRNMGHARNPVMRVGFDDVPTYLAWLSQETGERYRLPSEAQWEYAARGGINGPYYTGSAVSQEDANYGRYFVGRPLPVGSFLLNPFGLFDMLGNVGEWCEDCWNANYVRAPTDGSAWLSGDCDRRVLRGGHWASDAQGSKTGVTPRDLRSATRGVGPPPTSRLRKLFKLGSRGAAFGFRVVREL